jgi:hypothetical protein
MGQLQIKMHEWFEFSKEKNVITFCSQLRFVGMKASLVAYDGRKLHRKPKLKKCKT